MCLVFSRKGMTVSFGHLRRVVSHAGLSKASGGACWKIQRSSRGWSHRVHGVTNSIIQREQFGLTGFQIEVFRV